MAVMGSTEGFFEEDEPVEDVVRAFDQAEHSLTEPPHRGRTLYLDIASLQVTEPEALPFGELVGR